MNTRRPLWELLPANQTVQEKIEIGLRPGWHLSQSVCCEFLPRRWRVADEDMRRRKNNKDSTLLGSNPFVESFANAIRDDNAYPSRVL